MALQPWPLLRFVISFTQTVGLLGRVISPSQGRYQHTRQHKHRINAHTDIHALRGIRTNDSSVWAGEDSPCLQQRGHCDRWNVQIHIFLTSALYGDEWSDSRPCRFTSGERAPGISWIGGWVNPRACLDDMEERKFLTPPGLELRPLGRQPAAIRYTDYAIPASEIE
jgi:hypothetical protein